MFDLTTLADKPSEQELHQLAMKTVGDDLIAQGYEFVAVNSELKKDPQFVCKKEKQLIFIVVKATVYPANPKDYDQELLDKIKATQKNTTPQSVLLELDLHELTITTYL